METTKPYAATPSSQQRITSFRVPTWYNIGIRTKILVPIVLLMLTSTLVSIAGFVFNSNATRDSLLRERLNEETQRLVPGLQAGEEAALDAANLITNDPIFMEAFAEEQSGAVPNNALKMSDRVQPTAYRFNLNQAIVVNAEGQTRINWGSTSLEPITIFGSDLLINCTTQQSYLAQFEQSHLLIACTPITYEDAQLGLLYTIVDLEQLIAEVRRDASLRAEVLIVEQGQSAEDTITAAAEVTNPEMGEFLYRDLAVDLGSDRLDLVLQLIQDEELDVIINSGLQVMLMGSITTLVLLLVAGFWLSQSLSSPIHKLVGVASGVASGDLSRRANMKGNDEIGQLGRSFDLATTTISHLLDEQAYTAGQRKAILESIADGVLAIDLNEQVLVMNPAAAALLHQDADRVVGQPLSSLEVADDPILVIGLQQVVNQVRSELVDADMVPTEQQVSLGERVVRIQSAPTLIEGGTLTGAVVVIQDITGMVESDRAKSAFIATASHEMRTPLTSLKGFVDILVQSGTDNLTELQRMCVETTKRQTDNMIQLVNDLLEMARLEQGAQRPDARWIAPHNAVEEAVNSLTGLIEQRNVTVTSDIDTDLPSVWIDPLHLRRILGNLISNAVKYVYPGGIVQIRVYEIFDPTELPSPSHDEIGWEHNEERSLLFTISDNGVGIRESDQPQIFTRFFRSENPLSVEVGGTGLGLAITKSLIELHRGQIGFSSFEGEGSCFWIRLPTPSTEPLIAESITSDMTIEGPPLTFVE